MGRKNWLFSWTELGAPEFDRKTFKSLFMHNSTLRNWHYTRLAVGSGKARVANSSFCWGVTTDRPDAD